MDPLVQERLRKIDDIRLAGAEPFSVRFRENTTAQVLLNETHGELPDADSICKNPANDIRIAGRIMTFREHGRISFGTLQDDTGKVQICFLRGYTKIEGLMDDDEKAHEHFWKKLIDLGDYIGVKGDLFRTKHGELTILVSGLRFLSKAIRPLPEKFHGLTDREKCYRERNLDLISNPDTRARFRLRSAVVREIRNFYHEKGFEEVETRTLQAQAGGAMAKVFETHHNSLDHDFVLRIALELELKIACSGGFERVFEIGKCFRNEGSDPSHLQEFAMLEWYAAYQDLEVNREWTEEMVRTVLRKTTGNLKLDILGKDDQLHTIDFEKPFATSRFPDLLLQYAGIDMFTMDDAGLRKKAQELQIEDTQTKGRASLLDDIYKKTARPHLIEPTFVFDYPEQLKPLARPKGDGTAECFQLLIGGWEVVNSYGELIDPVVQRRLFEEQMAARAAGDEEAMKIDEDFLRAMEHGFPPMTGFGMGIDRFVAIISAQPNLRDVVLFPTMKPDRQEAADTEMVPVPETAPKAKVARESQRDSEKKPGDTEKKFVAVLNKKVDSGKLMNALGHMAAGIAGGDGSEKHFLMYQDADEGVHPNISHFPFIVLRADNSNQIRVLREMALESALEFTDFTDSMTVGTSAEQLAKTKASREEDLNYFGICLFGPSQQIDPITKKFSLWR